MTDQYLIVGLVIINLVLAVVAGASLFFVRQQSRWLQMLIIYLRDHHNSEVVLNDTGITVYDMGSPNKGD